jgi:hypothetical protein
MEAIGETMSTKAEADPMAPPQLPTAC